MNKERINAGEISKELLGRKVTVYGFVKKVRKLGGLTFVDLRDRSGIVQLVSKDETLVNKLRNEFVIEAKGEVALREVANPQLKTGEVEIILESVNILSEAKTTPLIIDDKTDALEDVRLKYRYLDLRRPIIQEKLKVRHQIKMSVHRYLDSLGFYEIETPILNLSTPEGARDYLVPSRLHHGSFYALPQSPQIFKQLLMIGGLEKYYQIARCFRDEDLRADRQPEFTQIDIEMSFVTQEEILTFIEKFIKNMFQDVLHLDIVTPFKRLTYKEAIDRYGSDKPDTRFAMEIKDLKEARHIDFAPFKQADYIRYIKVEGIAKETSRKVIDNDASTIHKFDKSATFVAMKYEDGHLTSSILKFMNEDNIKNIIEETSLKEGDVLFITASNNYNRVSNGLGALRLSYGKKLGLIDENVYDILFIIDFPLFELAEDGSITSTHHPFTRPHDEDLKYLTNDPLKVRAYAYDLVINGQETCSGSMRIYRSDMQEQIFNILGLSKEEVKRRFGFFVDAFQYGTPPHAGMAFGLDRLTMLFTKTDNIRDVIAFPKNLSAVCPMSHAPSKVDEQQLKDLGIAVTDVEND